LLVNQSPTTAFRTLIQINTERCRRSKVVYLSTYLLCDSSGRWLSDAQLPTYSDTLPSMSLDTRDTMIYFCEATEEKWLTRTGDQLVVVHLTIPCILKNVWNVTS
jgi:hypothetical protein